MKAITLTQPWATLVAIGAKQFETRRWNTSYRGPLAIHASKKFPANCQHLCVDDPFYSALQRSGYHFNQLPVGAIVATCDLVATIPTGAIRAAYDLTDTEIAFGDYSSGRYAWRLENVVQLIKPIPINGALGLWEWNNDN